MLYYNNDEENHLQVFLEQWIPMHQLDQLWFQLSCGNQPTRKVANMVCIHMLIAVIGICFNIWINSSYYFTIILYVYFQVFFLSFLHISNKNAF